MKKLVAIAIALIAAPALASPAEERLQAQCDAMQKRKSARFDREQLARNKETKDPNWAYSMEQKVREYTSRTLRQDLLPVVEIDCRTTFCDVKAEGSGLEASEQFQEALAALPQQSWNDFVGGPVSVGGESDRVTITARMIRKTSIVATPEQRADEQLEADCGAMWAEQAQRARAARDAEPRDASWAGPMEQLLREHLMTQMATYPMDRIEVTCKTTFCRIEASGRTKQGYSAFGKAVTAAGQEPWSDLRGGGEGRGGLLEDGWFAEQTLYRDSP